MYPSMIRFSKKFYEFIDFRQALNDEQVKAVLAFINSLDEVKKSFGTVDEDEEPEEDTKTLEERYIEKRSKTASNTKMSIVLNSSGEIKRTNDL